MTNANDLAYPFCWENKERENDTPVAIVTANQSGLTKREMFSAMILQGMLSSGRVNIIDSNLSSTAVNHADTLIKALNGSK